MESATPGRGQWNGVDVHGVLVLAARYPLSQTSTTARNMTMMMKIPPMMQTKMISPLEGWLVAKLDMVGALGMMRWWWWTIGKGFEWLSRSHLLLRRAPREDAQGVPASWTKTLCFACCYVIDDLVAGEATLVTAGMINRVILAPDAMCICAWTCTPLQLYRFNVTASKTGAGGNKVAHWRGEEGTCNWMEDAENKVAPVSLTLEASQRLSIWGYAESFSVGVRLLMEMTNCSHTIIHQRVAVRLLVWQRGDSARLCRKRMSRAGVTQLDSSI